MKTKDFNFVNELPIGSDVYVIYCDNYREYNCFGEFIKTIEREEREKHEIKIYSSAREAFAYHASLAQQYHELINREPDVYYQTAMLLGLDHSQNRDAFYVEMSYMPFAIRMKYVDPCKLEGKRYWTKHIFLTLKDLRQFVDQKIKPKHEEKIARWQQEKANLIKYVNANYPELAEQEKRIAENSID